VRDQTDSGAPRPSIRALGPSLLAALTLVALFALAADARALQTATSPAAQKASTRKAPRTPAPKKVQNTGCTDPKSATIAPPTPSADGPQPRYVCREPVIVKDPVWKGKALTYIFRFENEGEGDLRIRLRGG